jgi:hypothetical protein
MPDTLAARTTPATYPIRLVTAYCVIAMNLIGIPDTRADAGLSLVAYRKRPNRIVGRSDRPSSIVAPNRNITKVEIAAGEPRRPEQVEQHRAAEAKMRRRPSQRGFRSGVLAPSIP